MPYHTIVSWTALIAALAHDGHCQEALEMFYRMHTQNLKVDKITFLRVLDACSSYATLGQGQEIHGAIVEHGLEEDRAVGTSLTSMYGKCESLTHAKAIFIRMKNKDIVCWTSLITACTQNGHHEEALHHFFEMLSQGIIPDSYTYACVLDACSGLLLLDEGRKIHSVVVEGQLEQQFMVGSALINFYGKCQSLTDSKSVFCDLAHKNVVSWNALISALVENNCNNGALRLFWQMYIRDVKADNVTYLRSLNACSTLALLEEGREIHMAIIEHVVVCDATLMNSLVNLYGTCRSLCDANHLFQRVACCGVISWNVLISVHICNNLAKEALLLLHEMWQAGVEANNATFMYAVDGCSLLADLETGWNIHAIIVENGCDLDPMLCSAFLKMYGKCKSLHDAVYIFKNLKDVDLVSWTALIGAYIQNESCETALSAFCQMQLKGIQPDDMAYISALDACASLAALDKGLEIHHDVEQKGLQKQMMVASALIHMYGNSGDIEKTQIIFRSLRGPNLATWNAVLAAFAHNGQGDDALRFFSRMLEHSVQPDEITCVSILTACSHAGWIDYGMYYFSLMMPDFNILHAEEHYVCVVDILGRAGQLEEADQILQHLSVGKSDMAWLSLLGACRIHNDKQRALHVAGKLADLDNGNLSPLIIVMGMFDANEFSERTVTRANSAVSNST